MTAITVANTEWAILDDLRQALAAATIGEEAVFGEVSLTTSHQQARQAQFRTAGARAILRYLGTDERESPEGLRACVVSAEILLAKPVAGATADEGARVQEMLRLVNAAKNAIAACPPTDGCYWGDGSQWHDRLAWGSPEIDTAERPPWASAAIGLQIAYTLDNATSH